MPPNILLVVCDSVRARNCGLYGHANETTPFLSTFAENATVYTQARSAGCRSITGHASLFTGRTVEEHGLTSADHTLTPGHTVFESLSEDEYDTGVFSENVWITDVDIGLRAGFDTVVGPQNIPFPDALDARRFVAEHGAGNYRAYADACLSHPKTVRSLLNGIATKLSTDYPRFYPFRHSPTGAVYVDRFLDWQSQRDGPWAACINLMDAHSPYEPEPEANIWGTKDLLSLQSRAPEPWEVLTNPAEWWKLRALESLYDGTIRQTDTLLERLLSTLGERGILDDTLVVITSDHGEGFGELSEVRLDTRVIRHNTSLHEALLHVPLIVKYPGQTTGERRSDLAALTAFPDVVAAVRDGSTSSDLFLRDRVHATSFGLVADDQLRSRAQRFQDLNELEWHNDRIRAVYENHDDGVVKDITFGDRRAVRVRIRDPQTSWVESEIDPESVDKQFEPLQTDSLVEAGAGMEAVQSDTKRRLEELGYI